MTTTLQDLRPALASVERTLLDTELFHSDRWRHQTFAEHVRLAAQHLAAWEAGDRSADRLGHLATRALLAWQLARETTEPTS